MLGVLFSFVEISIEIGKTPSSIRANGRKAIPQFHVRISKFKNSDGEL